MRIRNPSLTRAVLVDLYLAQNKTAEEIALLFGYRPQGIRKRLRAWNIVKFRPRGEGTIFHGYKMITVNGKQMFEHRHVVEQHLNRHLLEQERVHHKNHDKLDNRIENLEIVTMSEHKTLHHPEIGYSTRFQQQYSFSPEEALRLYRQHGSSQRVANILGCAEVTARRSITRYANSSLKEIRKQ